MDSLQITYWIVGIVAAVVVAFLSGWNLRYTALRFRREHAGVDLRWSADFNRITLPIPFLQGAPELQSIGGLITLSVKNLGRLAAQEVTILTREHGYCRVVRGTHANDVKPFRDRINLDPIQQNEQMDLEIWIENAQISGPISLNHATGSQRITFSQDVPAIAKWAVGQLRSVFVVFIITLIGAMGMFLYVAFMYQVIRREQAENMNQTVGLHERMVRISEAVNKQQERAAVILKQTKESVEKQPP